MFESPELVPSRNESRKRIFEAVWIVSEDRRTACISSQAGCSLNCSFCATGTLPFVGNLTAWEIIDQVYDLMHLRQEPITNIVFMGMGEPFYNYDEVMKAADILHDPEGLNLGARHITISTAGVVPKIHQFIDEERPYNLAISLNHPDKQNRKTVMDIDERYPLEELLDSARRYTRELSRPITFEYVLIPEINMSSDHLEQLIAIARSVKCKVNLIPLNTALNGWSRPTVEQVSAFQAGLRHAGILAFNRGSPGKEVDGACGMLALRMTAV
jgi:23S rRNA (adenine2503-C2)-methyltransferase